MIDWTASMERTYEYYVVDPGTWKNKSMLMNVKSCTIDRDSESETRGSAMIDTTESIGECYIRAYLISNHNVEKDKRPLGTFLVQTPGMSFNGRIQSISVDAYTPLLELKEKQPPIGYFVAKNSNIMSAANQLAKSYGRAPVIAPECTDTLFYDFVANSDDTWLTFITDLVADAKYSVDVNELGEIIFPPVQDLASLQPVWTYNDDNSSILYPEITVDRDIYGIPNVVEVIYSNGAQTYYARAVNNDPNSPISTVRRGREIPYRVTDPNIGGEPTQAMIDEYAKTLLRTVSTIECSISYTHAYCPTRVGDCVRLNYSRAGLNDVKAKIISQSIKCTPACPVTEKAVFTTKLWR